MKKQILGILLIGILVIGLTGCGNYTKKNDSTTDNQIKNIEGKDNNEEHHFKAKVVEVGNGYIIVEPNEDEEERKSSDRFHIDNKNNVSYKEGQILAITYIGGINESYPAQIGVTNISIIESN